MSFMGWLGRSTPASSGLTKERELESLQDAMNYASLIMNDKFDEADQALSKETSSSHKFMRGMSYFQRALIGTEPEAIKKGLAILGEAEQTIQSDHAQAVSSPALSHQSDIYPSGTIYSLMLAEIQMMYAIVAIMNGNMTNAIKALMRMRKAYATMGQIFQLERDYAATKVVDDPAARNDSTASSRRSFDFILAEGGADFSSMTTDPVDVFIHTGLCYSYGVLQWALSIVPAPFDKVLAFMSYKGDRKLGHSLMWEASKYPENIHGALASFTTLIIYNGLSARCDIRLADAVPYDRVKGLIHTLQRLYPESHKWRIQESMMIALHDRKLDEAIDLLEPGVQDKTVPKFITALCLFEQGCKHLFAHHYEECAHSFTEIAEYTDWSYSLFHYIVGVCYVDAYRKAARTGADTTKRDEYAELGNKALGKVMSEVCKRKVLGRPVPIEVYIRSNMNRYLATQAAQKCTLVEAVDVSPAEELIWLYGGYDAMPEAQIQASLEQLDSYQTTNAEELARTSLLRAACLRNLGRLSDAREELETKVLIHTPATASTWGRHASNWVLPTANFDLAVCLWKEAGPDKQDKAKLQLCADRLRVAQRAGAHDMQTMHSIKLSTAIEALKKSGVQV